MAIEISNSFVLLHLQLYFIKEVVLIIFQEAPVFLFPQFWEVLLIIQNQMSLR